MSRAILTKTEKPSTPAANKSILYVNTNRMTKQLDDLGTDSTLNNRGLQDRNILSNGGFSVQQRVAVASTVIPGGSATTRAGKVSDRWAVTATAIATSSWAQIDTGTSAEAGLIAKHYGKLTQATGNTKFILSQFLANEDIVHLRGNKVRLSMKLKTFVGSDTLFKLGLLQLTTAGTVDTCPTFISSIGANGVDPTWGTNLVEISPDASPSGENGTVVGTALQVTSTTQWVRSSAVFTIPNDAKNLCVVLWKDIAGGTTDAYGFAEFQMTEGPDIVDYVPTPLSWELQRCQRYFCKSFPLTTVPVASLSVASAGNGVTNTITRAGATALASYINIQFPVRMWKTPTTCTLFTPVGAGAVPYRISGAAPAVQTTVAQTGLMDYGVVVSSTGDAAGVVGDLVGVHYTADAEFVT